MAHISNSIALAWLDHFADVGKMVRDRISADFAVDITPTFPTDWHGARGNVFCVGGRYQERRKGVSRYQTKLAALRWPERTLVLDSGEVVNTTCYENRVKP